LSGVKKSDGTSASIPARRGAKLRPIAVFQRPELLASRTLEAPLPGNGAVTVSVRNRHQAPRLILAGESNGARDGVNPQVLGHAPRGAGQGGAPGKGANSRKARCRYSLHIAA